MSEEPFEARLIIRGVIWGIRPVSDLAKVGYELTINGAGFSRKLESRQRVSAPPHIGLADIARGLLHYRGHPELGTWAFLMLAIDFDTDEPEEDSEEWNILYEALWSAAFGEPVLKEAWDMAEQLMSKRDGSVG